jgi:hypothetical protein
MPAAASRALKAAAGAMPLATSISSRNKAIASLGCQPRREPARLLML